MNRHERLQTLIGLLAHLQRTKTFMDDKAFDPEVQRFRKNIYPGETLPTYEITQLRIVALQEAITELREH